MKVCIIGGGASGWMAAHQLKNLNKITEIIVVTSDKIPPIGVGESTTKSFNTFLYKAFGFNMNEPNAEFLKFLVNIDAAYKAGVSYEGWSPNKFMHSFVPRTKDDGYKRNLRLLVNKPPEDNINDYLSPTVNLGYNNKIQPVVVDEFYNFVDDIDNVISFRYTVHFDANKFIRTMQALAETENKINIKVGTVVDLRYDGEIAKSISLDNGEVIDADYFISCVGQTAFNQKLFNEQYKSYSDILLTNKAVAVPLKYADKPTQFHPYTIAKTMKFGWRWITPTWSRIGTGYTFSDNHISVDQAKEELIKDIGYTPDIEPFVVDFSPRKILNPFKKNTCTIGMAAGFLEPLDAPGLTLTANAINIIENILLERETAEQANEKMDEFYNQWLAFILLQYKTSDRNDTQFWVDQKQPTFDAYEQMLSEIMNDTWFDNPDRRLRESNMFYTTIAGKGIKWKIDEDTLPTKSVPPKHSMNHYQYFRGLHELYS